jgi:hypothetical protein
VQLLTHRFKNPKEIVIATLGDIQWNGDRDSLALEMLRDYLREAKDRDAYYIGMGDYIDFASPSNRQRLKSASLYDNTVDAIQEKASSLTTEIAALLKQTRGRWLGVLSGHHYYEYSDGTNSDMQFCDLLDAPYGGDCMYIRLHMHLGRKTGSYLIWAHHGCGSRKSAAGAVQRLEDVWPNWEGDLFLMGHMTKRGGAPVSRISPSFPPSDKKMKPYLTHKEVYLVGTGGWSKAYVEDRQVGRQKKGCYVEKAMMKPVSLGAPFITLKVSSPGGKVMVTTKVEV